MFSRRGTWVGVNVQLTLAARGVPFKCSFTPSWGSSLGFTWTALLASLGFLQKPVATTRLLWIGMEAKRGPALLWKRAMDHAQPLTKKISWCGCVGRAGPQLQVQISSSPFSRKDEGTKGGPWVENMPLTIPSCKQKLSVSKTRLSKCHSPLTHVRKSIHPFQVLKEISHPLCLVLSPYL